MPAINQHKILHLEMEAVLLCMDRTVSRMCGVQARILRIIICKARVAKTAFQALHAKTRKPPICRIIIQHIQQQAVAQPDARQGTLNPNQCVDAGGEPCGTGGGTTSTCPEGTTYDGSYDCVPNTVTGSGTTSPCPDGTSYDGNNCVADAATTGTYPDEP